jgi:hypothetical protein
MDISTAMIVKPVMFKPEFLRRSPENVSIMLRSTIWIREICFNLGFNPRLSISRIIGVR